MIRLAIDMATRIHADQMDHGGKPYIGHPLRVARAVAEHGETHVIVALLHDALEDHPDKVTLDEVRVVFGVPVADALDAISKRDGEMYSAYLKRVRFNEIARVVKLADIADNTDPARMEQLDGPARNRLTKKYRYARSRLEIGQ